MTISWKEEVCHWTNHCPKTEAEAVDLIINLYYGGMSATEIGSLIRVSRTTIIKLLKHKGVPVRPRGGPNYTLHPHLVNGTNKDVPCKCGCGAPGRARGYARTCYERIRRQEKRRREKQENDHL